MYETPRTVVIVGAGPVGCLAALAMARRGWIVKVYDGRPDMRLPSSKVISAQRSINLAISSRGLTALQSIHPAARVRFLETAIPMRGRMIHPENTAPLPQSYDMDGQCINSIDRSILNEGLLDEVQGFSNISIHFRHKVQALDFQKRQMTVRDDVNSADLNIKFDLCIGADGSYSVVRRQMMRVLRMDFQQSYITHNYLELKMPAAMDASGMPTYPIDPNYLHIWPRHSFMLIALPNKHDKSFTCTLFAPSTTLAGLEAQTSVVPWFETHFQDALFLIGPEALKSDFAQNPISPLITTQCNPYHYQDCAILLGDAAHSMVPFYGQGLNCGFEDVRILDALLRQENVSPWGDKSPGDSDPRLARALSIYSQMRHDDLVAICDLAMKNYDEMRHSVTTVDYAIRKSIDEFLYFITSRLVSKPPFTSGSTFTTPPWWAWIPLYTMVTFRPDISYDTAARRAKQQKRILDNVARCVPIVFGAIGLRYVWIAFNRATWRFT